MARVLRHSKILCVVAMFLAAPFAVGQGVAPPANAAYVPTLTFDVATIRETQPGEGGGYAMRGNTQAHSSSTWVSGYRAADLIGMAYDIETRDILRAPDWVTSMRFDFQGKADSLVDDALQKLDDKLAWQEKQHMLQMVLAERMQLKVHPVTKDATVYELRVSKSGAKFKPSTPVAVPGGDARDIAKANELAMRQNCNAIGCTLTVKRFSMSDLADVVDGQVGTRVLDKTELTGTYDFTLEWRGVSFNDSTDAAGWPPLFSAIQEQLGLQLKPVKGTIPALAIDHIEKPSDN